MKVTQTATFTLVLVFGLALGPATASTRLLSQDSPVSPQPQSSSPSSIEFGKFSRPQRFQELLEIYTKIPPETLCQELIPKDLDFSCKMQFYRSPDNTENMIIGHAFKNSNRLNQTDVQIERVEDPPTLKKLVEGYKWQATLKAQFVQRIFMVEAAQDYLVLMMENAHSTGLAQAGFPLIHGKDENGIKSKDYVNGLQKAYYMIVEIHKYGCVAVTFGFINLDRESHYEFKIGKLGCTVFTNDPVGKCPILPLYTEPLILEGDGSAKADRAMDFYAFGIHLLEFTYSEQGKDSSLRAIFEEQKIVEMKKEGVFRFPKNSRVILVLLTAYLLQDDRAARSNSDNIRAIILRSNEQREVFLKDDLLIPTNVNPLTIPELQSVATLIGFTKPGALTGDSQEKESDFEDQEEFLKGWRWWIGGAVLVLIAVILFLALRKNEAPPTVPVEGTTELETELNGKPNTQQPVVEAEGK